MIGTLLVAEAFHYEIPKGYAYFAMAFSFIVELLNMKLDKQAKPSVKLLETVELQIVNKKILEIFLL